MHGQGIGGHYGLQRAMSLEEEIEMLEKMKEHLEANLANVTERLEKLKA